MFSAVKDPDDVTDYELGWSTFLGSDTVVASSWIVPDGLTLVSEGSTSTSATVRLSGGVSGERYDVTNRVSTASGCQYDRSIRIYVTDR